MPKNLLLTPPSDFRVLISNWSYLQITLAIVFVYVYVDLLTSVVIISLVGTRAITCGETKY